MAKTDWTMDDTVMPDDMNALGQVINDLQADGSATDTRIGERTISDVAAPTSNKGKLTTLLGWLAYMIKSITGKNSWLTAPATSLEAAKTHMDDKIVHITASERTNWNAKETTTGAQTKANAARDAAISAAATDATSKANAVQSNLNSHTNNSTLHPAKDGTLQVNLNVEMVNGIRIYKSLSEIGLTAGSETIDSVFAALPAQSELWYIGSGSVNYPTNGGLVRFYKPDATKMFGLFYRANAQFPEHYFGIYGQSYDPKWSGWARVPIMDGSRQINFNSDMVDGYHLNQDVTTTGTPTFNEITAGTSSGFKTKIRQNIIEFTRNSANYLQASTVGGSIIFNVNGDSTGVANAPLILGADYSMKSRHNTLDDGSGNGSIAGILTVPTPNINNKTNQVANTNFVNAYAVNAVANGSSADPNTTQESYILSNHANAPQLYAGTYWHIYTFFYSNKTGNRAQLAIQYNGDGSRLYTRSMFNNVWTGWDEKASLNSPNFTGIPTVPTASAGTNNERIANTAFVTRAVNDSTKIKAIDNRAVRPNNIDGNSLSHYFSSLGGLTGTANTSYVDVLALNGYHDTSGQKVNALVFAKGTQNIYHYQGNYGATTWGTPKTLAYTDSDISGNAATASKLETARRINGIAFDGTSNIITDKYGTTTGTSTAFVLTLSQAPTALYAGMDVRIKLHTNTGTNPTLNVNGLGAKALYAANGTDRFQGVAGRIYTFIYDGTAFILASGGGWGTGDVVPLDKIAIETGGTLTQLWTETSTGYARDVATDSLGNSYVVYSNSSGKTVRKLDASGNEVWANSDVSSAWDINVDRSGNVYVAHDLSLGSKTIRKLNASGGEIWSKTDVASGRSVVVDQSGNVYCAHNVGSGLKAIRKLNSSGGEVWSKTDVADAYDVTVDPSLNVYCAHRLTSGKTVRKLNSSGTEVWANTDQRLAQTIAVSRTGEVYVGYAPGVGEVAIRKLNASGVEEWIKADVSTCNDIFIDEAGYIYVANNGATGTKRLRKLNSSGTEIWTLTTLPQNPEGVSVDNNGLVSVVFAGSHLEVSLRRYSQNVLGYKIL